MDEPPKVLLVEGQDDEHIVRRLWHRRHRSEPSFDIKNKQGIDNLIDAISTEIKAPDLAVVGAAIGIVADANDGPGGRWDAISHQLRKAGVEPPEARPPGGMIVDGLPRVGVWLMPDNRGRGELEDFVREMIPSDDPAWSLAQKYIEDIPKEARKFSARKTSRAELHAWLATRKEPGFMGVAIGRGDLKTDGSLCVGFLAWIESLFGRV